MSVPLRLAGLLVLGACACSRPAQPEGRPSRPAAQAPEAGPPPAPATAASTTDAGATTAASTSDAGARSALSIKGLRRLKPTSGTHVIEGFITRVAPCPPCPEGAMCKPCMGEHVVVSDGPQAPENYSQLGAGDVIVFVPRPELMRQLAVGQKRRLTILIRPVKTTALPINDVELIDLSP